MVALTPAEITAKAEEVGIIKANSKFGKTFVSGILAGMYIAFGAVFSITSTAGLAESIPFGLIKFISGLTFSLGLILVMIAGAELFTGNALLAIAWIKRKITGLQFIKNLFTVYISNFVGALIVVGLVYTAGWHLGGDGATTSSILKIGIHKLHHTPLQAFSLGILCNILVCLGVWIAYSAKSVGDKVLGIIFPITAFVASGFEHSIANMFYLGMAYTLKVFGVTSPNIDTTVITLKNIFAHNLGYVTAGNIIGGAVFVGMAYWYIYGRK